MIMISVVVGVYMCRYVGICNAIAMCDYDICSCGYVYIHVKSIAMCMCDICRFMYAMCV